MTHAFAGWRGFLFALRNNWVLDRNHLSFNEGGFYLAGFAYWHRKPASRSRFHIWCYLGRSRSIQVDLPVGKWLPTVQIL